MKKSLCILFVMALIAQICARPEEKGADKLKGDAEKVAKGAEDKAITEGKGLEGAAADKAKGLVDKASKKEKLAAADKASEDLKGVHGHGVHPVSKMIKGMEKVGENVAKRGTDAMTDFLELWGL